MAGLTITALGCGNMGIAILSGMLSAMLEAKTSGRTAADAPAQLPTRIIACVKTERGRERVTRMLVDPFHGTVADVEVCVGENVAAVRRADLVMLGCKPYMAADVLQAAGMPEALHGKTLVSICAGLTEQDLWDLIQSAGSESGQPHGGPRDVGVLRVLPNTAAQVRESATVIARHDHFGARIDDATHALVRWMFEQVGRVVHLPSQNMDAGTSLCGSSPAFFALVLEAAADGAVAMGIPRAEAQQLAAQAMRGAASLVLEGEHPAVLREKVSTPGGCTIGGLLVLDEAAVRGSVARAVREATQVASELGTGPAPKFANGTRR